MDAVSASRLKPPLPQYRYTSLEGEAGDTIRLLTILPCNAGLVKCTLRLAQLNQKPDFRCLSYTWGKEEAKQVIIIDGQAFLLRHNLLTFLERFQREPRPLAIWIDAICVNQCDLQERTQHVRLMSEIYGQAEFVIVWLGDDTQGRLQTLDTEPAQALHTQPLTGVSFSRERYSPELVVPTVNAIMHFMSNLYWTRTWIVQELLLAQNVQIFYGLAGVVSLSTVYAWRAKTIQLLNSLGNFEFFQHRVDIANPKSHVNQILNCKFPNREGDWFQGDLRSRRAANMIAHFINTECTDPRDKVYAFLGFSKDQNSYGVEVDYTKSAEDLFLETCDAHTEPGSFCWPGKT